ncbi:hypothetical protein D9M68_431660 [compost metagenome]
MPRGDFVDGVEVGALTIQADRHDGPGTRGDGGLERRRIQVVRARVDIDEDRRRAEQRHGLGGRDVSEARRDDFVARPDAQRHLRDLQRIGAVGAGDAMRGAGVARELLLQFGDFRAKDVLAVGQHALDARVDPVLDAGLLGFQVDEFDHCCVPPRGRIRHDVSRLSLPPCARCRRRAHSVARCWGKRPRLRRVPATPIARRTRSSSRSAGPARPPSARTPARPC